MSFFLVSAVLLFPYLLTKVTGQNNEDQLLLLQNSEDQLLLLQKNGGVEEIILLDLQDSSTQRVVRSKHEIVAFDYHLARNFIFWATRSKIFRNVLRPTENSKAVQETVVEVGSVGGLAVDWAHDRLYWSDTAAAQLEVSRLNGVARQVLYRDGWPSSIVVDPLLGKIFWLDNNPSLGKIRYAHLDGSYPRRGGVWQSAPVLWQAGHLGSRSQMTLDTPTQELYFTQMEGNGGTVMAVDYRLKRIRVAMRCWGLGRGLAVADSKLYMSNSSAICWNRDGIFKSNVTTNILKHTKQMKLLSGRQQPTVPDKCDSFSCSQECFVVDDTPSCSCLFGFKLMPDNVTCSEQVEGWKCLGGRKYDSPSILIVIISCNFHSYVILFSANAIYRTILPSSESIDPYPKIQMIYKSPSLDITAVDVYVEFNSVFWSNNKDAIFKISVDKLTEEPAVIVNCTAKDISVDWIHNQIYWTEDSRVHMSSMDGRLQTVVAEDPNKPFSIVVDPINRLLFWSTCGWENMIIKAGLDGSHRTKLVSANISCATSLSVDSTRQRLYWVDRTHGTSSSVYYDGQIRHNVHDPRVQTVTVLRDKLLWTSTNEQWLYINQSSWSKEIFVGFEPRGVSVFNSISQPEGSNYCRGSMCGGLCVPGQYPHSTSCLCPLGQLLADDNITCLSLQPMALTGSPLEVIDYNSTSITLFCDHFFEAERYDITLEVLSSFQTIRYQQFQRFKFVAKTLPFTVSNLQPATTYSVTVEPHPTYLGVLRTEVSTSPPSQEVTRLPQVYKPWDTSPVPWVDMDDSEHNFTDSTLWQPLIREYFLLMFPLSDQHQDKGVDSVIQPRPLYDRIKQQLKELDILDTFVVAKHYKNKMDFDKDPEMHLTNTPFEVEFFLAMVQVSNYNGGYGVDIVLSERATIPWPR